MFARWSLVPAALAALAIGGCAVPAVDRFMLQSQRAPVRIEGARGLLTREKSEALLAELSRKAPGADLLARHAAVEEAVAGTPLTLGNRVTLLEDGPATYRAMLEAIAAARHHVHMESYIFEADEVGERFVAALLERRRAGIEVRLLVDGVGSILTPEAFFQPLADAGAEVVIYNPISAGNVLAHGADLQHRNHRKLTVVDGRVAFLGGINISGVYTGSSLAWQRGGAAGSAGGEAASGGDQPWRDTQVRVEGPAVAEFQASFLHVWSTSLRQPAPDARPYAPKLPAAGNEFVRAVPGSPATTGANAMYVALVSAIENAQQRVTITMAYFVPNDALLGALQAAARRGVDVRILLPSRTDNWLVLNAGRAYYDELLEAGVKLYEREHRMLHAKSATIDGVWSTVGSTNLDWRSLAYNEEINAVVLGTEFAAAMEASFQRDLARSRAITKPEWTGRPWSERAKQVLARCWALLL